MENTKTIFSSFILLKFSQVTFIKKGNSSNDLIFRIFTFIISFSAISTHIPSFGLFLFPINSILPMLISKGSTVELYPKTIPLNLLSSIPNVSNSNLYTFHLFTVFKFKT